MIDSIRREDLQGRRLRLRKRRRTIFFISLGVVVALIVFLVLFELTDVIVGVSTDIQSTAAGGNWPVFRHDLARTGTEVYAVKGRLRRAGSVRDGGWELP